MAQIKIEKNEKLPTFVCRGSYQGERTIKLLSSNSHFINSNKSFSSATLTTDTASAFSLSTFSSGASGQEDVVHKGVAN